MTTLFVKRARNLKEKIRGLIGKDKPEALMLKTHFGIHTFGVRFPIDVLILNKRSEVVGIKENLLPKRIFFWNPLYENVLELPSGTIKENKIKVKDKIKIRHMPY